MTGKNLTDNQMADWFNYIAFDLWHEIGDPEAESKYRLVALKFDQYLSIPSVNSKINSNNEQNTSG
jgi:hypothetical protein